MRKKLSHDPFFFFFYNVSKFPAKNKQQYRRQILLQIWSDNCMPNTFWPNNHGAPYYIFLATRPR